MPLDYPHFCQEATGFSNKNENPAQKSPPRSYEAGFLLQNCHFLARSKN
jgi:hypothetical protein